LLRDKETIISLKSIIGSLKNGKTNKNGRSNRQKLSLCHGKRFWCLEFILRLEKLPVITACLRKDSPKKAIIQYSHEVKFRIAVKKYDLLMKLCQNDSF